MKRITIFLILIIVLFSSCGRSNHQNDLESRNVGVETGTLPDEKYIEIYEALSEAGNTQDQRDIPEWITYTKTVYDSESKGRKFVCRYNEEYDSFDCFYVYEDVVIRCVYSGKEQIVTVAFDGRAVDVPWTIYHLSPYAFGLQIRKSDVTKDGNKDLLVSVTDEEGNVICYIYDLYNQRDISPYYACREYNETSGYSFTKEYLYYEYGQSIAEAVNEEMSRHGTEEYRIMADEDKGVCLKENEFYQYMTYMTGEGQLNLIYTYVKGEIFWECKVLFDISEAGCRIGDISVITERKETEERETYPLGGTTKAEEMELPTYHKIQ